MEYLSTLNNFNSENSQQQTGINEVRLVDLQLFLKIIYTSQNGQ